MTTCVANRLLLSESATLTRILALRPSANPNGGSKMRSRILLVPLLAAISIVGIARSASPPNPSTNVGSLVSGSAMLSPRSGHSATLLPDGRVLIAGGMRRNQDFYRSAELYDPSNGKFRPTGEMCVARVGHAAALLRSGKVLIAGGWIGHGTTDEAELYDPATGKFTAIAPMTAKRGDSIMTLLRDGNVLVTGGAGENDYGPGSSVLAAEIFDTKTQKFRATGDMHHARLSHTATLLPDGRVLIAGGRGSEVTASAELYDPNSGTFRETGHMLTPRYKHTAGLLPGGRVLLAGGSDERDWHGTLNSTEIYDPQRGTFTAASALNDPRFKLPPAVQLRSGQLLVAGGNKQVEVYDVRTEKFMVASGAMNDARHFMTETLLQDGRVLLAGGYAYTPEATAETWIYRP